MSDGKLILCTLFLSGWIIFFGSVMFDTVLSVHHTNIKGVSLNPLYEIIGGFPYLGLIFVIVSGLLILRGILKKKVC